MTLPSPDVARRRSPAGPFAIFPLAVSTTMVAGSSGLPVTRATRWPSSQAGGAVRSARFRAIDVGLAFARIDQQQVHVAAARQIASEGREPAAARIPGRERCGHRQRCTGLVRGLDRTPLQPGQVAAAPRGIDRVARHERRHRPCCRPAFRPCPPRSRSRHRRAAGSPIATGSSESCFAARTASSAASPPVRTSRPSAGCSAAPASAWQAERRSRTARVAAARRPGRLARVASELPIRGSVPPPGGSLHLETPEVACVAHARSELDEHLDGPVARSGCVEARGSGAVAEGRGAFGTPRRPPARSGPSRRRISPSGTRATVSGSPAPTASGAPGSHGESLPDLEPDIGAELAGDRIAALRRQEGIRRRIAAGNRSGRPVGGRWLAGGRSRRDGGGRRRGGPIRGGGRRDASARTGGRRATERPARPGRRRRRARRTPWRARIWMAIPVSFLPVSAR